MHAKKIIHLFMILLLTSSSLYSGTLYKITSIHEDQEMTYQLMFGGGFRTCKYTAFDPVSKKFLYLSWKRNEKAPEPVASIWIHTTGKTVKLFKFPGATQALPVIPSVDDLKFCPFTGSKDLTKTVLLKYD